MERWEEIAHDSYFAAQELYEKNRFRSCASRAYYAAYSALTGEFQGMGVQFVYGGANPSHEQVATLTMHNLDRKRFSRQDCRKLAFSVRLLKNYRLAADYIPGNNVGQALALDSLRNAHFVLHRLGYQL